MEFNGTGGNNRRRFQRNMGIVHEKINCVDTAIIFCPNIAGFNRDYLRDQSSFLQDLLSDISLECLRALLVHHQKKLSILEIGFKKFHFVSAILPSQLRMKAPLCVVCA